MPSVIPQAGATLSELQASPLLKPCLAILLGRVPYIPALDMQRRLHARVAAGDLPDLLLLVEHDHVITLGKRGAAADVLADSETLADLGIDVIATDRGGEATYHGPGQLVGYPIVNLRGGIGGALRYVTALESALVATLAEYGIRAESEGKPTGVWVGDAKIAAIGVKISRGVSMHGFALNVSTDVGYFEHLVPCGIPDGPVTSMALELGRPVSVERVAAAAAHNLGRAIGRSIEWAAPQRIGERAPAPLPQANP